MEEAVEQMKDLAKKTLVPTSGATAVEGLKEEVRIFRD